MALQPAAIYHLMQKVYTLFEQGKLKGQQETKLSGAGLQKALQGKNCAKLYHFKMFQGLEVHIIANVHVCIVGNKHLTKYVHNICKCRMKTS